MLRNMLAPIFNLYLDQCLTFKDCICFAFSHFWGGGLKPLFSQYLQQNAKLKETQKRKKDTICEHSCANCSCQNVRFFLHFSFWGFRNFYFQRAMFLIGSQDSKITNTKATKTKKQQQHKKMQRKHIYIILRFKTNKTTSRNTKTKEHLETKSKQNKN